MPEATSFFIGKAALLVTKVKLVSASSTGRFLSRLATSLTLRGDMWMRRSLIAGETTWQPDSEGFARIVVVDARGRAARAQVRIVVQR